MPRPILIGKHRRITISEFAALCKGSKAATVDDISRNDGEDNGVFLQLVDDVCSDGNEGVDEDMVRLLLKQLQEFPIQDDPSQSSASDYDGFIVLVGTLTLLAFAISQERIYHSTQVAVQITSKLVHIVNALVSTKANVKTFAKTPTSSLFQILVSLGIFPDDQANNVNNNEFVEHKLIPKYVKTTKIIITTHTLHEIIVTSSIDLCIAALSVQRLRQPASQDIFTWYDTLSRPHRSSVTVASIMKVLLEGSKYAAPLSPDNPTNSTPANAAIVTAIEQIPTTHGTARDVIASAYKTLEIELNSVDDPKGLDVQTTTQHVTMITVNILCTIVQDLIDATNLRCYCQKDILAITPSSSPAAASTSDIVTRYQLIVHLYMDAIREEAALGLQFAQQERLLALEEFRQKEAKKAARAAEFAAAAASLSATTNNANEFDGMSEAQIAKIVKKRAQKALKQQQLQQQQQSNKSSAAGEVDILATLFGVGTSSIVNLLLDSDNVAQNAKQFEVLVEKLQRGGIQRKPKIPKGTRDFLPEQMMIRDQAFQIIRRVFKRHGAVEIDTPVFELKETLTGKYGEDSKLIYDLADQGGELLSLRYDLTVPFARFLAMHKNEVGNIKRYHIGKVYRRDQPALARGRYREFYQCDFDIAGQYGRMIPDAECLAVVIEILGSLPIGCDFCLKVNHRRLLDSILDLCGVPSDKFRTICSAVDKLDKEPWEEVKREMVQDKGLESSVADKIGTFVLQKGEPWAMYKQLIASGMFSSHEGAQEALEDMRILFDYLDAMGKLDKISFDMSLARGLDYYTGVIYEAVCIGSGNIQMGSIGGGGRYDNLVAMFQEAGKITPCVGVSVGIERVFTLMEAHIRDTQGGSIKQANVTALVASIGEKMIKERMKVARLLWDANISAEYTQQEQPKLNKEITNALERGIPFMVIIGEEELKEQKCKIKDLVAHEEELVDMTEVVATLLRRGAIPIGHELAIGKNQSNINC